MKVINPATAAEVATVLEDTSASLQDKLKELRIAQKMWGSQNYDDRAIILSK